MRLFIRFLKMLSAMLYAVFAAASDYIACRADEGRPRTESTAEVQHEGREGERRKEKQYCD